MPVLIDMLKRGPVAVRLKSVISLRQIGGVEAVNALRKATEEDTSEAVREEASAELKNVGET